MGEPSPHDNHILKALPEDERHRLFPHLSLVSMPLGMVLYESGETLRHIYFPTDSIISLLYVMKDGASAEIAVVGNEGAIGVALFMGGETTPSRAIVQSAGSASVVKKEADPALCTMARLGVVSPPMNNATPIAPSLPTTAISAEAPSFITYSNETIEFVGK